MDVNDLKGLFAEVSKRMDAAVEHVRHELAGVRTGRASVTILDGVHVDAYGAKMPLNQVAGLSIPEPSLIVGGHGREPPLRPHRARAHQALGGDPQPPEVHALQLVADLSVREMPLLQLALLQDVPQ